MQHEKFVTYAFVLFEPLIRGVKCECDIIVSSKLLYYKQAAYTRANFPNQI